MSRKKPIAPFVLPSDREDTRRQPSVAPFDFSRYNIDSNSDEDNPEIRSVGPIQWSDEEALTTNLPSPTYDARWQPTSEMLGLEIAEENRHQQRSTVNKFKYGAALGAFVLSSQLMIYWLLALTSPNKFGDELDAINLIVPKSAISNTGLCTIVNYLIYTVGAATIFGILNVAKKAWDERRSPAKSHGRNAEILKPASDINDLFDATVRERQLSISKKQMLIGFFAFAAFLAPNIIYCYTFKDIGDAAKNLLPDYGIPLFELLNQKSGRISFLMNTVLNQWFSFGIIQMVIASYNQIQFARNHYHHKESSASWSNATWNITKTELISFISSISFYFLALDDKGRTINNPAWMAPIIPYAAFIVYGFVLNTEGTLGILKSAHNFKEWLYSMPKPIEDTHKILKKHKTYILGWAAYHAKEWTRELGYYFGCNKAYADNNDLKLPTSELSEHSNLITPQHRTISINADSDVKQVLKPDWSIDELRARVHARIRNHTGRIDADIDRFLNNLIIEERDRLEGERKQPTNAGDIWKNGRVRAMFATPWTWIGPGGLSIVLLGYFFLVNGKLSDRIYNGWFDLNTSPDDAMSRMLSLYLFYPFIKLVHDAGYTKMSGIFTGLEHKIQEAYHSWQILRGHINPKTRLGYRSTDFDYRDRFHFSNGKEALLFALGTLVFAGQVTAFLVTPSTAGTVSYLLQEKGLLNPFTLNVAFWFTALFNSFGVAGFLEWGKEKIIQAAYSEKHKDIAGFCLRKNWQSNTKWDLFRKSDEFFDGIQNTPDHRFDISELATPIT